MQIQFPTDLVAIPTTRVLAPSTWSVNQLLMAEVVGTPQKNFTRLAIGDVTVAARSDMPLKLGQKLAVQVVATGATIVLKVLSPVEDAVTAAINRSLARELPRQATPQETTRLVRELHQLARGTAWRSAGLPPTAGPRFAQDLSAALQSVLEPVDLTQPERLRAALVQAATPTEARVKAALDSGTPPDVATDLRAQLLRVQHHLDGPPANRAQSEGLPGVPTRQPPPAGKPTPSAGDRAPREGSALAAMATTVADVERSAVQLKQLLEGVIARLQSNQLQNLAPSTTSTQQPLVIEIPLFHQGQSDFLRFEFEVEQGRERDGEVSERASVLISLCLDDGQDFAACIRLSGESLSIRLGSNDSAFNALMLAHVDELRRQFEQRGVQVTQIVVAPLALEPRPKLAARHLVNDQV